MNISNIDHIGIRITEKNAALDFYKILGFQLEQEVDFDAVIIMKNKSGVEINLINTTFFMVCCKNTTSINH